MYVQHGQHTRQHNGAYSWGASPRMSPCTPRRLRRHHSSHFQQQFPPKRVPIRSGGCQQHVIFASFVPGCLQPYLHEQDHTAQFSLAPTLLSLESCIQAVHTDTPSILQPTSSTTQTVFPLLHIIRPTHRRRPFPRSGSESCRKHLSVMVLAIRLDRTLADPGTPRGAPAAGQGREEQAKRAPPLWGRARRFWRMRAV